MDRRTSIKWVIAAASAWPLAGRLGAAPPPVSARGYGSDPQLLAEYHPGQLWPLTLSPADRRLAAALADLIIPADAHSPSASAVGVVDFIDEWLSAPYPDCRRDRPIVLGGFGWLDTQAQQRFGRDFAALEGHDQRTICDEICDVTRAASASREAARFFARYRDLTAAGFYSTPLGRKDLGYIGNVPQVRFEGPPADLLLKLRLP
jgi:hypothetical protein